MFDKENQVALEPDRKYDPHNQEDYSKAKWRWHYKEQTSDWFESRDLAMKDAVSKFPGIGVG